jgi:hypothetical protein
MIICKIKEIECQRYREPSIPIKGFSLERALARTFFEKAASFAAYDRPVTKDQHHREQ